MKIIKFDNAIVALNEIQSIIIKRNGDDYCLSFAFRNSSNELKIYVSNQERAEECLNFISTAVERI